MTSAVILSLIAAVAGGGSGVGVKLLMRWFSPARRAARYAKWLADNVPHGDPAEAKKAQDRAIQEVIRDS